MSKESDKGRAGLQNTNDYSANVLSCIAGIGRVRPARRACPRQCSPLLRCPATYPNSEREKQSCLYCCCLWGQGRVTSRCATIRRLTGVQSHVPPAFLVRVASGRPPAWPAHSVASRMLSRAAISRAKRVKLRLMSASIGSPLPHCGPGTRPHRSGWASDSIGSWVEHGVGFLLRKRSRTDLLSTHPKGLR